MEKFGNKILAISGLFLATSIFLVQTKDATHDNVITCEQTNELSKSSLKRTVKKAKVKQSEYKVFNSDSALINDALKSIKKELAQRDGKPYLVSRMYKINGDKQPMSATTKIYYIDYRKKPDCITEQFKQSKEITPERVVEVVYRLNDKKHVSLVDRNPKHIKRRLNDRTITLASRAFV